MFKDDLQGLLDDKFTIRIVELQKLYTDFQPAKEGAIELDIDLSVSTRFANHYYRYLIRNYFEGIADIMHENFTRVKLKSGFTTRIEALPNIKCTNQFTIKVQFGRVSDKPELVLSYDGTTKVFAKAVSEIYNFNTNLYNWIVCNGVIYKWKYRPDEVINQPQNCYPILSNELKPHLEIAFDVPDLKTVIRSTSAFYTILQQVFKQRCFPQHHTITDEGFINPKLTSSGWLIQLLTICCMLAANRQRAKERL